MNAVDLIGKDCTVVIIAHRLSTIMNADCIYEFEKGKIKASGTFDELKTSSDSFKDMSLLRKIFEIELNLKQTILLIYFFRKQHIS